MLMSALLITTSLVLGQAQEPPSNFEHLKALDCLTGTWITEGIPKAGEEPFDVLMSFEWILNKNVQLLIGSIRSGDGEVTEIVRRTRMWDTASKQIKSMSVNSTGGHKFSTITIRDEQIIDKATGVNGEGETVSSTTVYRNVKDDSCIIDWKDRKKDGERLEDFMDLECKRVKK
jgi:hypothetical protein